MMSTVLDRKAYKFALKLQGRKQYPAAIIGAGKSNVKKVDVSQPISPLILSPKLKRKLMDIGELYTKHNGNILGCCAEVNAANHVVTKRPYLELKEIDFSRAIRPRTMQTVPMCKNCKITFSKYGLF